MRFWDSDINLQHAQEFKTTIFVGSMDMDAQKPSICVTGFKWFWFLNNEILIDYKKIYNVEILAWDFLIFDE